MEIRIYFVSTGRIGTSFMVKLLNKYYPSFLVQHQKKWSRLLNIISNVPLKHSIKNRVIKFIFERLRKEPIPLSIAD